MQGNLSFNHRKGTLRGMHFQYPPAAETKLVRCTRGAILDVIVDLRPESPTFLRHTSVELTADNRRSLYVPTRFAHGYQVLEDAHRSGVPDRGLLRAGARGRPAVRRSRGWRSRGRSRPPTCRTATAAGRRSTRSKPRFARGWRPGARSGVRRVIVVDAALRAREASGRPIRMGMIGAGFMGRGVANQVVNHVTGMRLSAVYARRVEQAVEAYTYATPGCEPVVAARRTRSTARSRPDGRWSPTIRSCCAVRRTSTH